MSPLTIGLLLVSVVAVIALVMNYKQIRASIEMFANGPATNMAPSSGPAMNMAANSGSAMNMAANGPSAPTMNMAPSNSAVAPNNAMNTEQFANPSTPSEVPFAAGNAPSNCYPKNQLNPKELLPADPNSKWAQVNPQGAGDIAGKNYLNAGALIGVNTVGQSLRNASWDLRSEPANPQVAVSPWFNSTIEPDVNRRTMEIA